MNHETVLLQGERDNRTGLWQLNLNPASPSKAPSPSTNTANSTYEINFVNSANSVYELVKQGDIVKYLHQACGSPVKSTWLKAIEAGYFTTWPGLTTDLVKKHLPKSLASAKGHLRQERQGLRSTQTTTKPSSVNSTIKPVMTTDKETTVRTNWVYMQPIEVTGQIYSDQTGRFPQTSSRGNKYIMIVYDYDSNAILAEPITSRTENELVRAYTKLHTTLTDRGLKPILQKLDNEAPGKLKAFMRQQAVTFQLVPPHLHRRNAAEKAISTWKDHFIATLSSTDPCFPLHLWCRLIDQATTTLNLLRPSRINPRLSAEAQLNGAFDYNKTPFAPPGTQVLVHEKSSTRRTWAPHGLDGWYIGRAPDHYRCHRVYITKTAAERIADTVEFFPKHCNMPQTTSVDAARDAATALTQALLHPTPATPFAQIGDAQMDALRQLATIFATSIPPIHAPLPRVDAITPPTPTVPKNRPIVPTIPTTQPGTRYNKSTAHRYPLRSQHCANAAIFQPFHLANAVTDPLTGQVQEYRHLIKGPEQATWSTSFANELGRLAQGVGTRMKTGTSTVFFIAKAAVPHDRKVTYGRIVAQIRLQKVETHRTRLTVGGDRLDYPGIVSTPTAKLSTAKCLINSTISTDDARFIVSDIKDFYLNTPMARYEYMRLHLSIIPDEIIEQYNLREIATPDGWVYMEIRKGMYGLKQAGIIANQRLTKHLAKYGYEPTPRTPGLWRHTTRPITFSLVVDDFGIKYVGKEHARHLIQALSDLYTVSTDWTGALYCGLTIKWDYAQRHVDISMPGYVEAAIHKFQHPTAATPEDAPHAWNKPTYGAAVQYAPDDDTADKLTAPEVTRIQQIIGTLLYYSLAVDPTMLVALGTIAATQTQATEKTAQAVVQLLNYAATHPDATIRYRASDMILYIHSDGSYLSAPKARSRAGGHFFLSQHPTDPAKAPLNRPRLNGPIHTTCHILRNVMASAAEAEVGALFLNGQDAIPLRTTLHELGHPQPPTPMQTDNSTAAGFANDTIKQKRSKAMDMRFYWIKDRVRQKQFIIYWRPGPENLGDYHTKHHSPSHHRLMRPTYLHPTFNNRIQRPARVC
jgi:hypothetical protein